MEQEFLDIVDEQDVPTGEIKLRSQVHLEKTDWHRTVSIWIVNNQGQFLCQQRSWKKDGNPGKWQSFFGGHVRSGQTNMEAVQDELIEEIGIDIRTMEEQPAFLYVGKGEENKHFGYYYILVWDYDISNVSYNDGEVEQAKWMNLTDLKHRMDAGDFCNGMSEKVLEYMRERGIKNV